MKGVTLVFIAITIVIVSLFVIVGYILIGSFGEEDVNGVIGNGETPFQNDINGAVNENNVEVCNEIEDSQKQVCISNYYFNQYKLTGDISKCDVIENFDSRLECRNWDGNKLNEALNSGNIEICEEIINLETKADCIRVLTKTSVQISDPFGGYYG